MSVPFSPRRSVGASPTLWRTTRFTASLTGGHALLVELPALGHAVVDVPRADAVGLACLEYPVALGPTAALRLERRDPDRERDPACDRELHSRSPYVQRSSHDVFGVPEP